MKFLRKNKGIIFIAIGLILIMVVLLLLLFNNKKDNMQVEKEYYDKCSDALVDKSYKDIKITINDIEISFPFLNCTKDITVSDSTSSFKTNDDMIDVNVYYKLIDIENLSNSNFTDYLLKEEYPSAYLFNETKENSKKEKYKILDATEIGKDGKEIKKLYQIMYPTKGDNSVEIEIFYKNNVLNEDVFSKIANEIKYKVINVEKDN